MYWERRTGSSQCVVRIGQCSGSRLDARARTEELNSLGSSALHLEPLQALLTEAEILVPQSLAYRFCELRWLGGRFLSVMQFWAPHLAPICRVGAR